MEDRFMLPVVNATRYITPLREGGSLPAIVEADDGELYVMKFVGAGHGEKALIAELLGGEIARVLGLNVPELAFIYLDEALGPSEPDAEIHDLLRASVGLNLGLRYLPKAFAYNLLLQPPPHPALASAIVWFDALITNVDRTPQNVNLLIREDELWLIDHGSALYFHHNWADVESAARTPFSYIRNHTLLPFVGDLGAAEARLKPRLTPEAIASIVGFIPDEWLNNEPAFATPAAHRQAYVDYFITRLDSSDIFRAEAEHAQKKLL